MAIAKRQRPTKLSPWAVKVANYLLLIRKDALIDLLRAAGQSVSTLKHKPPEQIRQALLALPMETLRMILRERIRRMRKPGRELPLGDKAIGATQGAPMKLSVALNNVDVAVYALYFLGGVQKSVHTENIALKCYELAPLSFSWTRFPQYPDTEPARIALMDARKSKNGSLVRGDNKRKLWVLTPAGVGWIKSNRARVEEGLHNAVPPSKRQELARRLHEILKHKSFAAFQAAGHNAEISDADFVDSLKCTLNSAPAEISERLMRYNSIATEIHNKPIIEYLKFCRSRFHHLLPREKDN